MAYMFRKGGSIVIAEEAQETRPGMSQMHMRLGVGIAS